KCAWSSDGCSPEPQGYIADGGREGERNPQQQGPADLARGQKTRRVIRHRSDPENAHARASVDHRITRLGDQSRWPATPKARDRARASAEQPNALRYLARDAQTTTARFGYTA